MLRLQLAQLLRKINQSLPNFILPNLVIAALVASSAVIALIVLAYGADSFVRDNAITSLITIVHLKSSIYRIVVSCHCARLLAYGADLFVRDNAITSFVTIVEIIVYLESYLCRCLSLVVSYHCTRLLAPSFI